MADRRLKHYIEYKKRLLWFAKGVNVTVDYTKIDSDGVWIPYGRKIKISDDLPQDIEIASLLHELGHSVDDMLDPQSKSFFTAYDRFYKGKATEKQKATVIACEKRAWFYAERIAKRLKIELGQWFFNMKKSCLASYIKE